MGDEERAFLAAPDGGDRQGDVVETDAGELAQPGGVDVEGEEGGDRGDEGVAEGGGQGAGGGATAAAGGQQDLIGGPGLD